MGHIILKTISELRTTNTSCHENQRWKSTFKTLASFYTGSRQALPRRLNARCSRVLSSYRHNQREIGFRFEQRGTELIREYHGQENSRRIDTHQYR